MKWSINRDDIVWGWNGSSGGGTFERKTKITSCRVWMHHEPTKIRVEGEVPPGHYSKKEMQRLRKDLTENLLSELEHKVAKHLRIPGR